MYSDHKMRLARIMKRAKGGMIAVSVSEAKPKSKMPELDSEDLKSEDMLDVSEGMDQASQEMMEALKKDDAVAFSKAMCNFLDIYESKEDEPEEETKES